jgi:cell division protein FtsB
MLFALLVLATALFIEGIGTYISILGLSALFAGSPVVITMAVALDIGKVVAVSFMYKNLAKISWFMKVYMTIATLVLMTITSAGVFGYLSGEFQKAIAGNNQQNVIITSLEDEKTRLQARKQEIDAQIANLPSNSVSSRVRLMNQFKDEITRINNRLAKIDEELPSLQVNVIGQNVKIGPIMYLSQAFNTTPEQAVKWVILIIIFVFDPLAVTLLVAGNFLITQRKLNEQKPDTNCEDLKSDNLIKSEQPNEAVPLHSEEVTNEKRQEAIDTSIVDEPKPIDAEKTEPEPVKNQVEKEIITLNQIKKSAPKSAPRSSLEDIDSNKGDVNIGSEFLSNNSSNLKNVYFEDNSNNTVVVGGPSGRTR